MFVSLNFHNLHFFNFPMVPKKCNITFSLKIEYCNITFFTPLPSKKVILQFSAPPGLRGRDLTCTCVVAGRTPAMPDYSCPVSGTIVSCTVVLQPGAHLFGRSRCLPSAAVFLFWTHDMCDCLVIHDMCDCFVFGFLRHDKK